MISELRKVLKRLRYPFGSDVGLCSVVRSISLEFWPSGRNDCQERGVFVDLNNIVEQDQRAVKRITDPMMGFKSFWSAQKLIAGIETMHMVKKGQLQCPGGQAMSAADQFYSLAF